MDPQANTKPNQPRAATGSAYLEVSRDDLRRVTEALLSNIGEWQNSGPWQSEQMHCRFCWEVLGDDVHKGHDTDCPVLIAISIMPNGALNSAAKEGQ